MQGEDHSISLSGYADMPGLDKVIQDGGLELVAYTSNEPWENRCPHNKFRATFNLAELDVAPASATTVGLYCDYCVKLTLIAST